MSFSDYSPKNYFLSLKSLPFQFLKVASLFLDFSVFPLHDSFWEILIPLNKAEGENSANCSICTCINISCNNFIQKKN